MKVVAFALGPEGRKQGVLPCRMKMLHVVYEAQLQYVVWEREGPAPRTTTRGLEQASPFARVQTLIRDTKQPKAAFRVLLDVRNYELRNLLGASARPQKQQRHPIARIAFAAFGPFAVRKDRKVEDALQLSEAKLNLPLGSTGLGYLAATERVRKVRGDETVTGSLPPSGTEGSDILLKGLWAQPTNVLVLIPLHEVSQLEFAVGSPRARGFPPRGGPTIR